MPRKRSRFTDWNMSDEMFDDVRRELAPPGSRSRGWLAARRVLVGGELIREASQAYGVTDSSTKRVLLLVEAHLKGQHWRCQVCGRRLPWGTETGPLKSEIRRHKRRQKSPAARWDCPDDGA